MYFIAIQCIKISVSYRYVHVAMTLKQYHLHRAL